MPTAVVDALAVPGALSARECGVLATVAADTTADRALEVGHFQGRSTIVLLRSLPDGCELTTIDHHQGDAHSCDTDPAKVFENMEPHVGQRPFRFVDDEMLFADVAGPFGFVFYDAAHTARMVMAWWDRYGPMLADTCTLVYDDADWPEQALLGSYAREAGFRSAGLPMWRDPDADKANPETFTLDVLYR